MQDAQFWSKMAPRYARAKISDMDGYARSLSAIEPFLSGAHVLELGCGTGTTALKLAPHAQSYLGTDIAPGMIDIARGKLDDQGITGLSFKVGTVETLAPEDRQADVVLGLNYLHLLRDLPATLSGIHAMLPKGGVFISKTPCLAEMPFFIRWLVPVLQAVGKAPFVRLLSAADLEQALAQAGFECDPTAHHGAKANDARAFIVARKP